VTFLFRRKSEAAYTKRRRRMLQLLETSYISLSIVFMFLGIFSLGWLVVHIEHGRHVSVFRVASAIILGALLLGFGLHLFLLANGI
jgi:TRAP-type C4-dicarboxylate transport system permease small subunit